MNLHVHASGPRTHAERGAVIFIHGFPFHGGMWEPQLAALPNGWRGLAPDLPGFGRSPLDPTVQGLPAGDRAGYGVARPDEPVLTMAGLADDVADFIRREVDGPAVVCGLSMGGYVAFELVDRHPDLVRALVLADTRATPDSDDARENRARMARTARAAGTRPIAAAMIPDLVTPNTRVDAPDVVDAVRRMILDTPPETVVSALAGMADRQDSTRRLPDIAVPTLVLVGEYDAITPPDGARTMADAIPDARFTVVPHAGHLSNMENPGAFNGALTELLAGL